MTREDTATRRHGKAREDTTRHEKTRRGTRRHGKAQEDTTRHKKTRQGTRRHDKAQEDTTRHGHEGTGHEGTECFLLVFDQLFQVIF